MDIEVVPSSDRWPGEFAELAARLGDALGEVAARIDHIGSTSVPGLAAKDVIDVQVTVAALDDPRIGPAFASLGAEEAEVATDHVPPGAEPGPDWEKRYFRAPAGWRRTHLHVREAGRANQRYALLFRDYLRETPTATDAYGRVKLALATQNPDDAEAYYAVKDPVCDLVIEAAEHWAMAVGWTADPAPGQ